MVQVEPLQVPPREPGHTVEPSDVVIEITFAAWAAGVSSTRGAAAAPTRRRRMTAIEGTTHRSVRTGRARVPEEISLPEPVREPRTVEP